MVEVLAEILVISLNLNITYLMKLLFFNGGTLLVAQLVEALRYKLECRGFDSRWCHWNFLLT
jgi:hypothetical protein